MQISYGLEQYDVNDSLNEAAESVPGQAIRVRVQPQLYIKRPSHRTPMYLAWRGVYWTMECADVQEGMALREAMSAFFAALPAGTAAVIAALDKLKVDGVESAPSEDVVVTT